MLNTYQPLKKPVFIVAFIVIFLLYPLLAAASKGVENGTSAWESSQSFIKVAKKAMPTVVFIQVEKRIESR